MEKKMIIKLIGAMFLAQILFTAIILVPIVLFAVDTAVKRNLIDKEFTVVYEN